MRIRTALTASLGAVVALGALSPAVAAPPATPKPITKTYTASATPDPSPAAGKPCQPVTPSARFTEPFKVPAAGTLAITIKVTGDWALALRTKSGSTLASSDGTMPQDAESIQTKFKKPTEVLIDACNFTGAPTAEVTYTFTYAPPK
ncbi:MAG: hypothetical protein H7323_11900 [Frankiales bacterium]|nr:hypothetical protein [Frankiales bacterium]